MIFKVQRRRGSTTDAMSKVPGIFEVAGLTGADSDSDDELKKHAAVASEAPLSPYQKTVQLQVSLALGKSPTDASHPVMHNTMQTSNILKT